MAVGNFHGSRQCSAQVPSGSHGGEPGEHFVVCELRHVVGDSVHWGDLCLLALPNHVPVLFSLWGAQMDLTFDNLVKTRRIM